MDGGRVLDAGLHLLDRQLVDANGQLAGKVDDLELTPSEDGQALYVTAILSGAGALAARLAKRQGSWLESIANRLFGRGVRGPWLLRALAGKGGKLVPYERISAIEADRVLISGSGDDLPAPNDAPTSAPPGG